MKRCALLPLFLLFWAAAAAAQETPGFLAVQQAVALLLESPLAQQEPGRSAALELRDRIDELQPLLKESGPSPDEQTAAALRHLAAMVREAANGNGGAGSQEVLDDVRRDLDLKLQYFRGRMGIVGAQRGLVRVVVKTQRKGKPVMGLAVFCNPYRWHDAQPMRPFSSLSSPTETLLMPGVYRCSATARPAAEPVASREIEVGFDGKETLTVEIAVP